MALDGIASSAGTSSAGTAGAGAAASAHAATASGASFRSILSDINPLQYIPVVGAVYRAITSDEGNPALRFVASLGTSFALGGPLGVGITVAEKITGIDPERIARSFVARLFHPGSGKSDPSSTQPAEKAGASGSIVDAANRPWTASELAAYAAPGGTGTIAAAGQQPVTADMLNAMELKRVSTLYA